jgi:DNA-damage-inducible protein J
MPATATVHIRVDEKVKEKATKALAAMGLSLSDVVRILLVRVAAEKALPFDIKVPRPALQWKPQSVVRSPGSTALKR